MLYQGTWMTNASGKLGTLIASRNRGGPYVRAYTVPADPNTTEQQAARASMAYLVNLWKTGLTATQRARWARYTLKVRRLNRIGELHSIGGFQEFIRGNMLRQYETQWLGGIALPDLTSPPSNGQAATPLTPVTVTGQNTVTATFDVNFNAADPWNAFSNGGIFVFVSTMFSPTKNWFRGPWTLVGAVNGGASSPLTCTGVALPVSGDRFFVKVTAQHGNGMLSVPQVVAVDVP